MELKNIDKLPKKKVASLLKKHTEILFDALGRKLVGVYAHGSLAMGGFNFNESDIDYLVVISDYLTENERKKLSDEFLKIYNKDAPKKGVEMSIVLEKFCGKDFVYPTPYEFHMRTKEQLKYHGTMHKQETDFDLAAHFVITKKRGICIYGKSIKKVFAEVSEKFYLDSIAKDAKQCIKNIEEKTREKWITPQYAILNFCRVLAFIQDKLVTSKIEGAEWAIKNFPEKYHNLILSALAKYRREDFYRKLDSNILTDFTNFVKNKI